MKRTVTWDTESLADMKRIYSMLKSDMGNLRVTETGETRNDQSEKIKNACHSIMRTNVSSMYGCDSMLDRNDSYVYFHCDPTVPIHDKKLGLVGFLADLGVTHLPFYVGKGKGDRCNDLDRNDTHRKVRSKIRSFNQEVVVHKVSVNLTEHQALAMESKFIDMLRLRVQGGLLVNLDEGFRSSERRVLYKEHLTLLSDFYKQKYEPTYKSKKKIEDRSVNEKPKIDIETLKEVPVPKDIRRGIVLVKKAA
jgi:hypothetical protein